MPQMGGGRVCVCIALGICWFFAEQCVVFTKKKRQNKHYLKIIVLAAVPGGEMARGMGADIEGPKNNTAMSKLLPQANYPFGNSSDTSS